jgi:hypothetical protein
MVLLGLWMLYVEPQSAQDIQGEKQPTQQYTSPNPPVDKQQKESDQRSGKKENDNKGKKSLITEIFQFIREYNAEIVTISTAIMAVFTIGLFISTHLLWKSGERHSEQELRAYVGVVRADIKRHIEKGTIKAEIQITNRGQTPAYDLTAISSFDFHEIPRKEFGTYGKNTTPQSRSTILPNEGVPMTLYAERVVTSEDLKSVREERFAFFFYGTISYKDAFGKDRRTDFRFIAGNNKSGTLIWEVTPEGNECT